MRLYETVLILKPTMSDPEVAEYLEKTRQAITGGAGEILSQEIWGRRKLTHMIGKSREGVYLYFKYKAAAGLVAKLDHSFKVSDSILRHSFVVIHPRKVKEKPKKAKTPAAA